MKKRVIEAALILAAMLLVFFIVDNLLGSAEKNLRRIDGEYYNINERSISLILMTEEGTEFLKDFSRLDELTVMPYKRAAPQSVDLGDEAANEELRRRAEYSYSDCTDLERLDFIRPLTGLKTLDISLCGVTDLGFVSELKGLEKLNISHTAVSDLSALSELDSITELVMADIPAEDLSPLLEMDSLVILSTDREFPAEITQKLEQKGVVIKLPQEVSSPRSTEEGEQQRQSPEQ